MKPPPFLVARCPRCGIPWPTCSRTDLRLQAHSREARTLTEKARGRRGLGNMILVDCEGEGSMLDASEYGENGDPRFAPLLPRAARPVAGC
jgi:hypothetical protein